MGSVALHALTRQRGMQQCAAFCRQCARCRFVSLSVRHRDCSWFYACDVQRLAGTSSRERQVWGFRTLSRDELAFATEEQSGFANRLGWGLCGEDIIRDNRSLE